MQSHTCVKGLWSHKAGVAAQRVCTSLHARVACPCMATVTLLASNRLRGGVLDAYENACRRRGLQYEKPLSVGLVWLLYFPLFTGESFSTRSATMSFVVRQALAKTFFGVAAIFCFMVVHAGNDTEKGCGDAKDSGTGLVVARTKPAD